jgi:hypothetical protein
MKQLAVRNVDKKDKTGDNMKVPEEVGIELNISEVLRQEIAPEGDPVVGTGRCEVS